MKIVVIEPLGIIHEKAFEALSPLKSEGHDVKYYETRTEDEKELIERGKDADIIIVANLPLRKAVIEKCENLKMISVAFTGFDHIDIDFCSKKGIAVSNAAGYSTKAVAELTFGLAISLLRNIPACDSITRKEGTKNGLVGRELYGKTFGVVGTGAIGKNVCDIAKVFGCEVLAYSRTVKPELEEDGVKFVSLETLLKESDIVSLHLPFNKETTKLIDEEKLGLMKPNSIIINTARGGVIDSEALAKSLNEGKISGAGIDVFEMEPPIPSDHPLMHSKNTVVTPHVAFATEEALFKRAGIVVENILKWEKGEQVNKVC